MLASASSTQSRPIRWFLVVVQFLFDAVVVVDGRLLLPVDRPPTYHQTKRQTRRQNAGNKASDETRQNRRLQSPRRL